MKVAIIGSGISGLTCAYLLNQVADVHVYESQPMIGGHTATKDVLIDGTAYAVDTGFIVFNDWTYPNFIRLLDELGVSSKPTEMSFSVTSEISGLEYSGSGLRGLFAQRRNLLRPKFYGMLKDIIRFNRESVEDLDDGLVSDGISLGDYLLQRNYSVEFIEDYLIPMGSAIWSASHATMMSFPLIFFIRFFKNHGLLSVTNRPQWRVIEGGSRAYLSPLTEGFKDRIHLNSRIRCVERTDTEVVIEFNDGRVETFDQVVFACHSDQALELIKNPSEDERAILGAMAYQSNDVVLHTDHSLLPKRRQAWASWNYRIRQQRQSQAVLTYNMNTLQGIESDKVFCVTLNDTDNIQLDSILGRYQYSHPVFTPESVAAAARWSEINGHYRTWFCGAYWANGFHEDGCSSGIRVATSLGAKW
ncbi:MAG: NAD(P)/FAD-dependent oxidoreductase [Cellvibrionaceae bacterium]